MSLGQIISRFEEHVRRCHRCGSWPALTSVSACVRCLDEIERCQERGWIKYPQFRVNTLYRWEDEAIKNLIVFGKGNHREDFWSRFAQALVQKRIRLEPGIHAFDKLIFSCSPTREWPRDQAERLLKAILKFFPAAMIVSFSRSDKVAQKERDRLDRSAIHFTLENSKNWKRKSSVRGPTKDKHLYVFVDDVITTGHTAMAAFEALGKPENYEVWTICHRPLLRS